MRKEPALKLKKSPLVFVLSQVRFSPVLKMEGFVPDIQEALRLQGFPRYKKEDIQQVTFGGPDVRTERDTRWVFSSRNQTEAIVLASTFVVYETTDYDVFETFVDRFSPVLDIIARLTKVEFADQLGLRYLDLIRPEGDKSASDFLRERVRGLSQDDLGATNSRHQFMIQAETQQGTLHVRSFENSGRDFMPPDLISTHLRYKVDPDELGDSPWRILDIDHIAKGEFDFDSSALIERLWGLHEYSIKAFLAAVTEKAIAIWKGDEEE